MSCDGAKVYPCNVFQVLSVLQDLIMQLVKTFHLSDEEKITKRNELTSEGGMIHILLSGLTNLLSEKDWFAGDDISEAEIALYAYSLGVKSGRCHFILFSPIVHS